MVGRMAMVRNSVGAEGYVADEILTTRAGTRVRVTNTDAEAGTDGRTPTIARADTTLCAGRAA